MNRRAFVVAALSGVAIAGCRRHDRGTEGRDDAAAPGSNATGDARRIVSVTPATTEALFAVGAGDRVVGRSRFCDYPPAAAKVPVVGGYVDVDLEAVLGLAPDLVVGAAGPSSPRLTAQLEARGVRSWFPELGSCAAIAAMIEGCGERTGNVEAARQVIARMRAAIDGVRGAVVALPPRRVLLVLSTSPIVAAGPGSFIDELIAMANASNVVRTGPAWQTVGAEQVIDWAPDVVLDATADPGGPPGIDPAAPGWRSVASVRDGHVAGVNDPRVLRPGPRVAEGFAMLARSIHPDAVLPHA
jgi:iron complex transport system substrate-binding protein